MPQTLPDIVLTGDEREALERSPTVLTPRLEASILAWTRKPPTDGSTHWSTRKLARALNLSSHTFVQRAADIFAFGALLYEMATGRRAFEATTQASLIAKILETRRRVVARAAHASRSRPRRPGLPGEGAC